MGLNGAIVGYDNGANAATYYTDAAGSNTTHYPDRTHPSLTVQTDMEIVARPVLNAA